MFMFNLLFDFADPDGLFSDLTDGNPLRNSKHWFLLPAPTPPPGFDPENLANWPLPNRLGKAGPLHIPGGANHDIKPLVANDTLKANMGALYARVAGAVNPVTTMPSNIALFPRSVSADAGERIM